LSASALDVVSERQAGAIERIAQQLQQPVTHGVSLDRRDGRRFHPDAQTVIGWLEQVGLTVQAVERPLSGHCFVRARRDD